MDDLAIDRAVVSAVLGTANYLVDEASSAQAAYAACASTRYDLVLMDVTMPETDGFAATDAIRRQDGVSQDARIVGWSAARDRSFEDRAMAAGMDAFVAKSSDPRALLDNIETLLRRHAPSAGGAAVWDSTTYGDLVQRLGAARMTAFVCDLRERFQKLKSDLDDASVDEATLATQVHDLRSVAGMLGFAEVLAVCTSVQRSAFEGSGRSHRPDLGGALVRAIAAIDAAVPVDATWQH